MTAAESDKQTERQTDVVGMRGGRGAGGGGGEEIKTQTGKRHNRFALSATASDCQIAAKKSSTKRNCS